MSITQDTRILELLSSKICHDLISPVGAIANGVEILQELGGEASIEVIDLISYSATQASSKLKALRLAYGLGGADSSIKPEDVHTAFGDFIGTDGRLKQDWDSHAIRTPVLGAPKILMCGLLLAAETLPKGGTLRVTQESTDALIITAEGENAHFRDGVLHALERKSEISDLAPQHVHAYVTALLAQQYGFSFTTDLSQKNFISLRINFPDVS